MPNVEYTLPRSSSKTSAWNLQKREVVTPIAVPPKAVSLPRKPSGTSSSTTDSIMVEVKKIAMPAPIAGKPKFLFRKSIQSPLNARRLTRSKAPNRSSTSQSLNPSSQTSHSLPVSRRFHTMIQARLLVWLIYSKCRLRSTCRPSRSPTICLVRPKEQLSETSSRTSIGSECRSTPLLKKLYASSPASTPSTVSSANLSDLVDVMPIRRESVLSIDDFSASPSTKSVLTSFWGDDEE
jgi:hypothetical protein